MNWLTFRARLARAALAAPLLATLLAGAPLPLVAHDFHMGIAAISYNPRTGATEVVHNYTAHDVEAQLARLNGRPFDLGRKEDQQALRAYLEQRFYLLGADGRRLPLAWVGVQADADSVTVYQELAHTRLAGPVRLHNGVLTDFLADQKNTVNVDNGGPLRTLIFDRARPEQALR